VHKIALSSAQLGNCFLFILLALSLVQLRKNLHILQLILANWNNSIFDYKLKTIEA